MDGVRERRDLGGWLALAAGALLLLAAGRWIVAGQLGDAPVTGPGGAVAAPVRPDPEVAHRCRAPGPTLGALHPGLPAPGGTVAAGFRETPQRTGTAATLGPVARPVVHWRATGPAVVFSSPAAAGRLV